MDRADRDGSTLVERSITIAIVVVLASFSIPESLAIQGSALQAMLPESRSRSHAPVYVYDGFGQLLVSINGKAAYLR